MEVAFGRRAVADPAHRDPAVALDRRGHRPADRLRELRAEIAGDREEAVRLVRIHDRQLAALQLVAFVRIDLVHHLRQRIAARDEQALLAIGREVHVVAVERGLRQRPRSPPRRCTSCRSWSSPAAATRYMRSSKIAHGDHVAQHLAQRVGVELRVPRADRADCPRRARGPARSSAGAFRRRCSDVGARRARRRPESEAIEKSGVSPGRNGGSGTCSASFGALRRSDGSLSLMCSSSA